LFKKYQKTADEGEEIQFFVLKKKLPEGLALLPLHLLAYEKSQIQRAETEWNKSSRDFFTFFQVGETVLWNRFYPLLNMQGFLTSDLKTV
jgi:hypothetical protein